MTDLELLELLDKAQQRNTGPQGEPGVGIDKIEQYDDNSVTFVLSSGATKKVNLPSGAPGEAGSPGRDGAPGDVGPAGRDGRKGTDGLPGPVGPAGADGSFLDTAIVSTNGHLLLGVSDGTIIDAGRVVGPAGISGERGPVGLAGQPGQDGISCVAAFNAPTELDGKDGDSWIDCSSAEFGFYRKSGNGWSKIADLRQPAPDRRMGIGAGTAGGGGSGGSDLSLRAGDGITVDHPAVAGDTTVSANVDTSRGLEFVDHKIALKLGAGLEFDSITGALENTVTATQYRGTVNLGLDSTIPENPDAGDAYANVFKGTVSDGWAALLPQAPSSVNIGDLVIYSPDDTWTYIPTGGPDAGDGVFLPLAGGTMDGNLVMGGNPITNLPDDPGGEENATNKHYVDEADTVLQGEIDELRQELDDLAPSLERGEWEHSTSWPESGQYAVFTAIPYADAVQQINDDYIACIAACNSDPTCTSNCNREQGDAMAAIAQYDPNQGGTGWVPEVQTDWEQVNYAVLHETDAKGIGHSFEEVSVGEYITIGNRDDDGYMNARVLNKSPDPNDQDITIFEVDPAQWSNEPPSGRAIIRFFSINDDVEATDFVLKTGDTMSGQLTINSPRSSDKATNSFVIRGNLKVNGTMKEGQVLLKDYRDSTAQGTDSAVMYFGRISGTDHIVNLGYCNEHFLQLSGAEAMHGVLDMGDNHIANVKDPASSTDAVNLRYANGQFMGKSGEQKISSAWKIRSQRTDGSQAWYNMIDIKDDVMHLYHVADARENAHGPNWGQVQNYVKNPGDNVTINKGHLVIYAPETDASKAFDVRPDGYESGESAFSVRGNGKVKAGKDSANAFMATDDNDIVTKKYFDDNNGGSKVNTGTVTPSLAAGEMFLNTSNNMLYIGK